MSTSVNGYSLNQPGEVADWSQREFNLLSAFAGLMPVSGSRVVSAGEHFHNILTNQNGVPALFITSAVIVDNDFEVWGNQTITDNLEVLSAINATGDIAGANLSAGTFVRTQEVAATNNVVGKYIVGQDDIYTVIWKPYTPDSIGGLSTSTSAFKYKEVGDLVFVKYDVSGVGNDATTYFSLPVSAEEGTVIPVGYTGISGSPDTTTHIQGMRI